MSGTLEWKGHLNHLGHPKETMEWMPTQTCQTDGSQEPSESTTEPAWDWVGAPSPVCDLDRLARLCLQSI